MNRLRITRNLRLLASHPSVFLGGREYVLILSHMRSYSSLLAHLLGSHPEVSGYAEMNVAYKRRRDLVRLRAEVARSLDGRLEGRFVLDKVLHDHHPISHAVLSAPVVHPIFLVRRPVKALASIVKMNERLPELALYPGGSEVTTYYVNRLATLEQLALDRRDGAFVLRAESLVTDPETALARLGRFLGLRTPIETSYSTFPLTGVPGSGDFSGAIWEGHIRSQQSSSPQPALSPDLLDVAERAYAHCLETLESLFGHGD